MAACRAITFLFLLAGVAEAGDWQYSFGVHDFSVPQADSDTFGLDARATFDRNTASGRYNIDLYAISGLPPILPWDHDVMYRLLIGDAW